MVSLSAPRTRRVLRFAGWSLLAIAVVVVAFAAGVWALSERRLRTVYPTSDAIGRADPALAQEGRHLAVSRGCTDCHGRDLAGHVVADDPLFGRLVGTNLTRLGAPADVHRVLRTALLHGTRPDGTPLMMMPSKEYSTLSAREIEALSAYVSSLPPQGAATERSHLRALGRTLLAVGKLDGFLSAETIDHARPVTPAPPTETVAFGGHMAALCTGCHKADFGGGPVGHGKRGSPPASNLTRDDVTGLGRWSEADFIAAIRSGVRPDGTKINPRAMPLTAVGSATDDELKAIWAYLRSRPAIRRDVHAATE